MSMLSHGHHQAPVLTLEPFLKPGRSTSFLMAFSALSYAFFTSGCGSVTVICRCELGCGSAFTSIAKPAEARLPPAWLTELAAHRAGRAAPDLSAWDMTQSRAYGSLLDCCA